MCAPFGAYSTFLSKVIVGSAILHHPPPPPTSKGALKIPPKIGLRNARILFIFMDYWEKLIKSVVNIKWRKWKKNYLFYFYWCIVLSGFTFSYYSYRILQKSVVLLTLILHEFTPKCSALASINLSDSLISCHWSLSIPSKNIYFFDVVQGV